MQTLEINQPKDDFPSQLDIKIDPAFKKVNKHSIAFQIWQIEEGHVDIMPKSEYGYFYDNCTYIVYASNTEGQFVNQETISREVKPTTKLDRCIHFWIGEKTTPQKSANIAYKLMELDVYFGTVATQYRESQKTESARFMSYFKNGIMVLSGALKNSGQLERLYRISGKQYFRCTEMETISWEHFSSNYVMIIKAAKMIFIWYGRSTTPPEQRNGMQTAKKLQNSNEEIELVSIEDGYEQAMTENTKLIWNQILPLKNRFIHSPPILEQPPRASFKLYKCGYNGPKYCIEELKNTTPVQADLNDSDAAFIIDSSCLGIWIWVGSDVTQHEKIESMRYARGFVKKKKYQSSTPVVRVIEGTEPLEFQRLFPIWKCQNDGRRKSVNQLGRIDSLTLAQRPKVAAETQLLDDGTGEKYIHQITLNQCLDISNHKRFTFSKRCCYVIQYSITNLFVNGLITNGSHHEKKQLLRVLYVWYGSECPKDTIYKCDIFAKDCFDNMDKASMMIKIHDGYETPHFLQMFGGKLIIFTEKVIVDSERYRLPLTYMLKINGDATFNARAVEFPPIVKMTSLDCYVMRTADERLWVWCGQSSTGDEREIAKGIASLLGEYTLVMESAEAKEFWINMTDRFEMANNRIDSDLNIGLEDEQKDLEYTENGQLIERPSKQISGEIFKHSSPSLYLCLYNRGMYMTQEIIGYEQNDLEPEFIYILDTGTIIFIWIGAKCPMDERINCWNMTKAFLRSYPVKRDEATTLALIQQNYEPNVFKGFFESWDENSLNLGKFPMCAVGHDKYTQLVANKKAFDKFPKYPISVLQQETDLLPPDVDPIKKEVHLTYDDFMDVFNMTYSDYEALPAWKQKDLKKKIKLF